MSEWKPLPEEELVKMSDAEFAAYLAKKPPPDASFLDWERDMLARQVAAGMITQAAMDEWLALRKKNAKGT